MTKRSPFRYFKTSPEIIRLAVMLYIRFPLSLRNVEDLLHERGIEISHETVRYWWDRFGPMFAAEIRGKRVEAMRAHRHWQWHLVSLSGAAFSLPDSQAGLGKRRLFAFV
jgi:putative transposase